MTIKLPLVKVNIKNENENFSIFSNQIRALVRWEKLAVMAFKAPSLSILGLLITIVGTCLGSDIKSLGGTLLMDGKVEATQGVQSDRQIEFLGVSTPSYTPSSNHSFLWLNNSPKQLCTKYDDGSTNCLIGGNSIITSVTSGVGLTGGGSVGAVTLSLSTPIASTYLGNAILNQSSLQSGAVFNVSSATVVASNSTTINVSSVSVLNTVVLPTDNQAMTYSGLSYMLNGPVAPNLSMALGYGAGTSKILNGSNSAAVNNLFVGSSAGSTVSAFGTGDTFIGVQAGANNTDGFENTCVGFNSCVANTTGIDNNCVGNLACASATTQNHINAHGFSAAKNTTQSDVSAYGDTSLFAGGGFGSSCFGSNSCGDTTTGRVTGFGYQTLLLNVTGTFNSCFGYQSCYTNTTGDFNSSFGYQSMQLNTTGTRNTYFGTQAGESAVTVSSSSCFGDTCLANATVGPNSCLGFNCLASVTTGSSNTAVGYQAGFAGTALTTGRGNVLIGNNAQVSVNSLVNAIAIGHDAVVSVSSTAVIGGPIGSDSGVLLKVSSATVGTLDVSSGKITNLANGTSSTDAAAFGQIRHGLQNAVQCTVTTSSATTSTTFIPSNLACSITPTTSSSRIKITVSGGVLAADSTVSAFGTIARGTTNLGSTNGMWIYNYGTGSSLQTSFSMTYIDSPATTASTTYTVYFKNDNAAKSVSVFPSSTLGTMILEELK